MEREKLFTIGLFKPVAPQKQKNCVADNLSSKTMVRERFPDKQKETIDFLFEM